ncbi:MAG TPA: hypothetical protein VJT49_03360 [Amycolatopsis sp.]|uniref:hypothetical protein n=1 Tax=Amycolatopsis sp. TaxID=37632 RepID=UPI002B4910F8|nr:hypothetical protein [Amycolatopsis sp.]HKS44154.1 hypothetical protein [Amycolatopsis sp.]
MTNPDREPSEDRDRRRLDDIFGEVLPDTTSDERDPGSSDRDRESWYEENRPPHHG